MSDSDSCLVSASTGLTEHRLIQINPISEDFAYAAIHRTMPMFPIVPRKPSLSTSRFNRIFQRIDPTFRSLASEFGSPKYRPLLNSEIVQSYRELGLVIAFRESCIGNETDVELIEIEYFNTLWLRAQHSLITFSSSCCFRQDSDVQSICRIVVPIFAIQNQLDIYRQSAVIESLMNQFLEILKSLDLQDCWGRYTDLMVWAFMFGAYTSTQQAQREWFLFGMTKGGHERVAWQWEEVRKSLLGCFYVDRLFEADFRMICEEVRILDEFASHLGPG